MSHDNNDDPEPDPEETHVKKTQTIHDDPEPDPEETHVKKTQTIHDDPEPDPEETHVKKSTFNALVIGLIIAGMTAAFFAGSFVTNTDQISEKDLEDAISKLELRLLQNQLPATVQPSSPPVKISADDDPLIGDPNASITIIEFSDFQCPFCARFYAQTLPLLLEEYIEPGKVNLVFRDFPIQSSHPNALPASVAAECANEQGKFKEMHDTLFETQKQWNTIETVEALSLFSQYAAGLQLEQETFDSCLTTGKYIEEIKGDLNDGRSYGITGTPEFFIGNSEMGFVELKGAQPIESFRQVIDAQLHS